MIDAPVELTEEQRGRIQRNRELALQRREAKRRCLEERNAGTIMQGLHLIFNV